MKSLKLISLAVGLMIMFGVTAIHDYIAANKLTSQSGNDLFQLIILVAVALVVAKVWSYGKK